MAALNQTENSTFAISATADRILSSISGDFAEVLLKVAESHAKSSLPDGTKLVTVDDIKRALGGICDALEELVGIGKVGPEIAGAIKTLREFCNKIPSESSGVRTSSINDASSR